MRSHGAPLVACVVIALITQGCGSGASSGRARPSLGDAMEQAEKEPEDQEPVRPTKTKEDPRPQEELAPEPEVDSEVIVAPGLTATATSQETQSGGPDEGLRFGAFAGYGGLSDDAWESYRSIGAFFGMQRPGASAAVRIGGYWADFGPATAAAIEHGGGMFAEGVVRLGLMREHTFADLGFAGLARAGFLTWDYRNPITIDEGFGTRESTGDYLGTFALMVGPAFTPARSRHFSLEVTLLGGGQFYTENTLEGLRNDVFDATWMFELTLDVAYRRTGDPLQ